MIDFSNYNQFLIHFCIASQNGYYNEVVEEEPEEALMELIARVGQTLMRNREESGK